MMKTEKVLGWRFLWSLFYFGMIFALFIPGFLKPFKLYIKKGGNNNEN